jgi:hypothetical protein
VSATKREENRAIVTVTAMVVVSLATIPVAKMIGKKTITVVKVEAVIAIPTSDAPTTEA